IRDFHVTGVQTCALPIWPWKTPDNKAAEAAKRPAPRPAQGHETECARRQSANSELTDSAVEMRRMVSPSRDAQDSWRIFAQARASSFSGMVWVTTSSSRADSWMRLMASPDSTGCVQ